MSVLPFIWTFTRQSVIGQCHLRIQPLTINNLLYIIRVYNTSNLMTEIARRLSMTRDGPVGLFVS